MDPTPPPGHCLPEADLLRLLRYCAEVARWRLAQKGPEPNPPVTTQDLAHSRAGLFVSWKNLDDGALRGCIGLTQGLEGGLVSLAKEIVVSAARSDPRFPAIPAEDLLNLSLGITVLGAETPWPPPRDPETLDIGGEGLRVRHHAQSGVLLPQVAVEWQYRGEQFLQATCRKAELAANAWRDPEVEVFRFPGTEITAPYLDLLVAEAE